jgi:hypothetical protein
VTTLRHLADEICVGLQIYVSGRAGSHLKTAFVLCDDYTELATKLYLIRQDKKWSDQRSTGGFKNYHEVLKDLVNSIARERAHLLSAVEVLHVSMHARRSRRNIFFHSTTLLDLQTSRKDTAEALTDLFRYCELLFEDDWSRAIAETADLEALTLMVRLDDAASRDSTLLTRVNALFARQPKNVTNKKQQGVHLVAFPEDLHALMCAKWGGQDIINDLRDLLRP